MVPSDFHHVVHARRLAQGLGLGAVLASLAVATAVGTTSWGVNREVRAAALSAKSNATRDVAIVPGSRVWRGRPASLLAARLDVALALYRQGRVHQILVSGNENAGETSAMVVWLLERGIPSRHILSDTEGSRTIETMRRAEAKFGVRSAFICTQPISMPRSLYLARVVGIDAVSAPAGSDPRHTLSWNARELAKSVLAVAETIGRSGPSEGEPVFVAKAP